MGISQYILGRNALARQEYQNALDTLNESYNLLVEIQHRLSMISLVDMAHAFRGLGQPEQSKEHLSRGITQLLDSGIYHRVSYALPPAALLAADQGFPEKAISIDALANTFPNIANSSWYADVYKREISEISARLPDDLVQAARARAKTMDVWETLRVILGDLS